MGCENSKSTSSFPSKLQQKDEDMMMESATTDKEFKIRLEKKLCNSKENPDTIFDLSECNLEKLPGTFSIIKVLRKEILLLHHNRLNSLVSGGSISELELLQVLDISHNKFKVVPIEICGLKNLRELFLSNNLLTYLPSTINRLSKLELLDVSNNDLSTINTVSFMPELKILNISANKKLIALPSELATCDNLCDLVFDIETISFPSQEVLATGTQNILKYLDTGERIKIVEEAFVMEHNYENEDDVISKQSKLTKSRIMPETCNTTSISSSTKKFMEHEKMAQAQDYFLENQLHIEQQRKKAEMLKSVIEQQRVAENAVSKIQLEKDSERKKLIGDIKEYEESSTVIVNQLLTLKKGPDATLLEQEDKARDALLEKVHLEQSELRKKDVLSAMSELLEQELNVIQNYQDERSQNSKVLLESETKNNLLLNDVFQEHDKNRRDIIERVNSDEQWQKSAVATLIAKNDARSWGLMEQIKIVEQQIAAMTNYEIDKKKLSQEEILNDVADKRVNLTFVLLDLMEQQDKRKKQLLETLSSMEAQKSDDDFWLMQYQKLLDTRGVMQSASATIDPVLGYNFLLNGVIHVVPFLLKIWQGKCFELDKVTDEDLMNAGIRLERDRKNVLKSINDFLAANSYSEQYDECTKQVECKPGPSQSPSAPQESQESPSPSKSASSRDHPAINAVECVICMDADTRVIFLPCGHMCSCIPCSSNVNDCPMCRTPIERKIRVIQP